MDLKDVVDNGIWRVALLPVWGNEVLISGVKVKHPDPDNDKLAKEILLNQSGNVSTFGFHEAGINHMKIPAKMIGVVDGIEIDNSKFDDELLVLVSENGLNLMDLWNNGIILVKLLPKEEVVIDGVEFKNPYNNAVFPIHLGQYGVVDFSKLNTKSLNYVTIPEDMTAKLLTQVGKADIKSFVNKTNTRVKVWLNTSGAIDLDQLKVQYSLRTVNGNIEIHPKILPSTSTGIGGGISRSGVHFMATTDSFVEQSL